MSTVQKRQHYVWKYHIDAWATNKKVWCYRRVDGNIFNTNTVNLANERYFYQTKSLTKGDILYLDKIVIDGIKSEPLRALARGYVNLFTVADQLENAFSVALSGVQRKKLETELENVRLTLNERYHGLLESQCVLFVDKLRSGIVNFIQDEKSAIAFFYFLANQYFRTAKLRNRMCKLVSMIPDHSHDRTWAIEAHIFACNIAASMFLRRNIDTISILNNGTDVPLITTDQPVVNLLGADDKELDLYYPLSPKTALRLSSKSVVRRDLSARQVRRYNRLMFDKADDQIYSNDEYSLKKLSRSVGALA